MMMDIAPDPVHGRLVGVLVESHPIPAVLIAVLLAAVCAWLIWRAHRKNKK